MKSTSLAIPAGDRMYKYNISNDNIIPFSALKAHPVTVRTNALISTSLLLMDNRNAATTMTETNDMMKKMIGIMHEYIVSGLLG